MGMADGVGWKEGSVPEPVPHSALSTLCRITTYKHPAPLAATLCSALPCLHYSFLTPACSDPLALIALHHTLWL